MFVTPTGKESVLFQSLSYTKLLEKFIGTEEAGVFGHYFNRKSVIERH